MRGILKLGATLLDEASDHRYGIEANERAGFLLDDAVSDDIVATSLDDPDVDADDVRLLTIPGWLWYLDYLIGVGRLPADELLIALWDAADHEVLRFRILEAVLRNEASSWLAGINSLEMLDNGFVRWILHLGQPADREHGVDHDDVATQVPSGATADIEVIAGWLFQIGSAPAHGLLRAMLRDATTSAPARDTVESFVQNLGTDPSAARVRAELGLESR